MRLNAIAKLVATVDLPTPPLPEATIRINLILEVPRFGFMLSKLSCSFFSFCEDVSEFSL